MAADVSKEVVVSSSRLRCPGRKGLLVLEKDGTTIFQNVGNHSSQ